MIADDSMSDDVFEMDEAGGNSYSGKGLNVLANTTHRTPSPTGYKDYQPPKELFEIKTHTEEIAHKVRNVLENTFYIMTQHILLE